MKEAVLIVLGLLVIGWFIWGVLKIEYHHKRRH